MPPRRGGRWAPQDPDFGQGSGRGGRNQGDRGQRGREGGGRGRGRGASAPQQAFPAQASFQASSERPRQGGASAGAPVPVSEAIQVSGYQRAPQGSGTPEPRSSVDTLVAQASALEVKDAPTELVVGASSSKSVAAAPRPDLGTLGTKVAIRVNHFKMNVKVNTIFHYDVSIRPAVGSKGIARALERQLVLQYRASELNNRLPVYDGSKSLYTAGALPFECKDFKVILPAEEGRNAREYKVTIKLAARLDQHQMQLFLKGSVVSLPHEFLQALDVALREWPMKSYVPSGRNFFDPEFGRQSLENGFEAWKGFYQSVRPTMQGLALNIDVSATAFYEAGPVLDFLRKSFPFLDPSRGLSDTDRRNAAKLLKRLKVEVTHRPFRRRYRISGLSALPTKSLKFTADESGTEVTVMNYFRKTYRYEIRYPEMPCLELQGKKTTYLPMEVCELVAGQKYLGKLNERQTTNMLKFTCQVPAVREKTIQGLMNRVHDFKRNEYATEFGIHVDNQMTLLQGRILPTPRLKYMNNELTPKAGEWNMLSSRFLHGVQIHSWTLVNFSRITNADVQYFIDALMKRCGEIGVRMNPPVIPPSSGRLEQYHTVLRNAVNNYASQVGGGGLQLIVCVMEGKHQLYGDLKKLCETDLGVVTQCCLKKHVMRDDRSLSQYLANLAMKINVKVGGLNMTLSQELKSIAPSILNVPTIIFGADVSHPMARDETSPSIAAVVASMDWPSPTRYQARARAQTHRVERIEDLELMVNELMHSFYRATRKKPQKLLFFRDGVSEGQFYDVLCNEVRAIRMACARIESDYCPQITFVVVQKRHHTRFFPTDQNVVSNNVCPGTVVDTQITHPREFDFYLCSHKGLQGTSRPTHYHVLLDENRFKADELQTLVNNLCYTYARCTKAVSVVPPAYYAHLVAYRARLYVDSSGSDLSSGRGRGRGGEPTPVRAAAAEFNRSSLPAVKQSVQNFMYYC